MKYFANVTQGCNGYYDMKVSVEANSLGEAEELILSEEFEVEDSEINQVCVDHYDQINCYTYRETLVEAQQILNDFLSGRLNLDKLKDLEKQIEIVLTCLKSSDIEIHSWEEDYEVYEEYGGELDEDI